MQLRRVSRRGLAATIVGVVLIGTASVAYASQITLPAANPFAIPGNVAATVGTPQAVDVVATGFIPNQNVFIEQCDGKDPADPTWSVAIDCDFGLSPSAAIADDTGKASFVGEGNNFQAFKNGKTEAQNKFNCIGPDDPATNNGKPDWTTCRIRVDVNPSGPPTGLQTFLTITMPDYLSSVPHCGLGAGMPQTVKPGQPPKPNKNLGTIKLAPSVTNTVSAKPVTLKLSGTVDRCVGLGTRPNQKLPITGGAFTASVQVPAGSMCPSTFVPGAPLKGSLTIKWTGPNPKTGKPSTAAATDTLKVLGSFTETSTSPLTFSLQAGPWTSTKNSFQGHSPAMRFVVDQDATTIAMACAVKGGLKALNFTGVQGPSMLLIG